MPGFNWNEQPVNMMGIVVALVVAGGLQRTVASPSVTGHEDPEEWELPPKPKWMRWATYNANVERFDDYKKMIDEASISLVLKRLG